MVQMVQICRRRRAGQQSGALWKSSWVCLACLRKKCWLYLVILVYLSELSDLNLVSFCDLGDLVPGGMGRHNPFFTGFFLGINPRVHHQGITSVG